MMFMALFVSAFNLGAVLFRLIDLALPDPAGMPPEVIRELLRLSVSALVVASPVFAFVTRVIRRGVETQPSSRGSRIRLQLTYLTLFVASCVVVGAVTALVYSLLGGQLTARFVLKSLTVTAIAGGAFGYYLRDLREVEGDPREARAPRRRDPLPALGAGAVAVAVVAGLVALGSPTGQRLERLDARRAQDLDAISHAIDRYEATYERLPATLAELQRGSDVQVTITDPVTREPYGYEAGEGTAYELCATFELATAERELRRGRPVLPARGGPPLPSRFGPSRTPADDVGIRPRRVRREVSTVPSSRSRWGRILFPVLFYLASVTEGSAQPARTQGWVLGLGSGTTAVSFESDPADGAALVGLRIGYGLNRIVTPYLGAEYADIREPRARGIRQNDIRPRRPRCEAAPGRWPPPVGPLWRSCAYILAGERCPQERRTDYQRLHEHANFPASGADSPST